MENRFQLKGQPEKETDKIAASGMEMRSLALDKERLQQIEVYFKLKQILQNGDEPFLVSQRGTPVRNSDISEKSRAKLIKAVLNNEVQTPEGLLPFTYQNQYSNGRVYLPRTLAEQVAKLPADVKKILITYVTSQFDQAQQPNIEAFDRVRRECAIQQSFWDLYTSNPPFPKLLEFINSIEVQDDQDKKLVESLTRYASEYRRLNYLNRLYQELSEPNPNFKLILEEIKSLGVLPSQEDKKALVICNEIAAQYELSKNTEDALLAVDFAVPLKDALARFDAIPARPQFGSTDPISVITELKEKVNDFYGVVGPLQTLNTLTEIRESYGKSQPEEVFKSIDRLPESENYEVEAKNILLREYEDYLASTNSLNDKVREEIKKRVKPIFDGNYQMLDLGDNEPAKAYMMGNFSQTFFPLFQSLRSNPTFRNKLESYIIGKDEDGVKNRLQFVQKLKELEKQRPLTEIERMYIRSIEQLTKFNPYIIALSNEVLGETDEYLRNHFDTLSKRTWEGLEDGSYVPAVQIGTGPNGLAFFGEVARERPDLASQTLIVDSGNQPGGPFAIPNGPAWELNSANRRGPRQATMPDAPGEKERKTIRAYGSPVTRWYPGERKTDQNIRQGSINTTVDYLPTPDDLSTLRYPTNEELQIILATQSAMLIRKATFDTRVTKVSPNTDSAVPGDKIVTLERTSEDGKKEVKKIYTDAVINPSGLGEPSFGFETRGKKIESVIERTKGGDGFPKVSDTLTAFRALADRRDESVKPPRSLAFSGSGNSTDVLVEYIAELFASGNPLVRNVEEIYIIATDGLSQRPRYAKINDVKSRNGKENLIDFISARIGDVGFKNPGTTKPSQEPLVFFDEKGNPIRDGEGNVILADAFVSNAGFKPKLDDIYRDYLMPDESLNTKTGKRPVNAITLPTNKKVAVADELKKDPNIIFIGTASNPNFNNIEKLAQLPIDAREALLRNGAENAVAIGFRAPDSQAAARIFIERRDIVLPPETEENTQNIQMQNEVLESASWEVPLTVDLKKLRVAGNVASEDDMLSALLVYEFNSSTVTDYQGVPFSGEYTFEVTRGNTPTTLRVDIMNDLKVDKALVGMVTEFLKNKFVENYTLSGFKKKRLNPKLRVVLKFRNGKIDLRNSLVQIS